MEKHTSGPIRISKCQCSDPVCKSYHLSTIFCGMVSEGDAHLYAASPALLEELIERNKLLGCLKVLMLQKDFQGALEMLNGFEVGFADGPITKSEAIKKALNI